MINSIRELFHSDANPQIALARAFRKTFRIARSKSEFNLQNSYFIGRKKVFHPLNVRHDNTKND